MTRQEYLDFYQELQNKKLAVTKQKNHDYAGHGDDNPFANFELVEKMGFISTEEGFVTRMTDKLSRIMTYIRKGRLIVENEGIEDALMDLSNYCDLLMGYIKSKNTQQLADLYEEPKEPTISE